MASGNFYVGRGLSLEDFNTQIEPRLVAGEYMVPDKLDLRLGKYDNKILISLCGKEPALGLNTALIDAAKSIGEKDRGPDYANSNKIRPYVDTDWVDNARIIGKPYVEVIGVYNDDNTASQLFPNLAYEHLVESNKENAEEFFKYLQDMGDKLRLVR